MIDLADYDEEMKEWCRTVTAKELQEILDRAGYPSTVTEKMPDDFETLKTQEWELTDEPAITPSVLFDEQTVNRVDWESIYGF